MTLGFIYKISNSIDDRLYIGSTSNIPRRLTRHKLNSTKVNDRNYNMAIYVCMRELGRHNFYIHHLETIEYEDKSVLLTKEREWIERLLPALNQVLPTVSAEETTARVKKWHTDNKEHVKEYKKQHYLKNKTANAEKRKAYYEANKEHLKAKAKLYAKATPKIKTLCECGGSYMTGQKNRHCQTDLHKNWILYQAMTPEEKEEDRLRIIAIKEQKRLDANMKRRKPKV